MTRRTYVYDADADAMIQVRGPGSNYYEPQSGLQIIRDIDPYRAAGSDIAADNKRPMIGGRRQHREFLRRNNYIEVGNEIPISGERPTLSKAERVADIRKAMGYPGGYYDKA
jgi:hypothetical protein